LSRPLKLPLLLTPLLVIAWLSFACGQLLRKTADTLPASRVRVSAMPEAHVTGAMAHTSPVEQEEDSAQTFLEVLRYVKSEYVDRVDDDRKLGYGAVRTMLVSMDDPKTRFYDPAQRKQLLERLNGEFHGIGATLAVVKLVRHGIDQRRVAVVAPVPGRPRGARRFAPGRPGHRNRR
jgi:Periplasmic protease